MLTNNQWSEITNYIRSKINYYYDPSMLFVENANLRNQLNVSHKGFYIGFVDSSGNNHIREGFLQEGLLNILQTVDSVIDKVYASLKTASVPLTKVHSGTIYLTVVTDVVYLPDPTTWDETKDGVYFQWGQDHKGMYLPYQIQQMNLNKIDILDRLCSWECGLVANLWRCPEGIIHRISCFSYNS